MDQRDWEAWDVEEPPRGFAERVVSEARRPEAAPARPRARRVFAGLLLAASMAAVVGFGLHRQHVDGHGAVTADRRQEVHVGTRALAVLEKGAHVSWDGDAVEQSGGDVFWRVEPGARFVVHTPAADVAVKGTCFRVNVTGGEDAMDRKSAVSGAVGAVIAATALVGVYEGKVAVSHAGQSVDLVAGQSAQAGPGGLRRVGGGGGEGEPAEVAAASPSEGEKALTEANANLADNVRSYRRKLEALEAEKKKLEKQLAETQAKLADAAPPKSEYELSPQDWKELAKEGELRLRVPCSGPRNDFSYSPGNLNKLGLAPQDAPIVQQAFQRSNARTWGTVQPLCSQALGGADVSRIGLQACMSILGEMARTQNSAGYDEDVRQVTEIMAGLRPAPAPDSGADPLLLAYLALARESQNIETDLSQSLGPEDARRVVFGDEGCWWNSSHGVGPRGGE
jgi:hypothetical protein